MWVAPASPVTFLVMSLFFASAFLGRAEFQELVSLGITELGKLRGLVLSKLHNSLGDGARLEVTY